MRKKTFFMSIASIVVLISWLVMGLAFAGTVLRFKIDPENNPTIEVDAEKYALQEAVAPSEYNPNGKLDPFQSPFDIKPDKIRDKDKTLVPSTGLTKWDLSQMKLTSTVVNGTKRFAAFNTPTGGQCYMGKIGDYIGKQGHTIVSIDPGKVVVALDDDVKTISIR